MRCVERCDAMRMRGEHRIASHRAYPHRIAQRGAARVEITL